MPLAAPCAIAARCRLTRVSSPLHRLVHAPPSVTDAGADIVSPNPRVVVAGSRSASPRGRSVPRPRLPRHAVKPSSRLPASYRLGRRREVSRRVYRCPSRRPGPGPGPGLPGHQRAGPGPTPSSTGPDRACLRVEATAQAQAQAQACGPFSGRAFWASPASNKGPGWPIAREEKKKT